MCIIYNAEQHGYMVTCLSFHAKVLTKHFLTYSYFSTSRKPHGRTIAVSINNLIDSHFSLSIVFCLFVILHSYLQ